MFRQWIESRAVPDAVWISAFYQPQAFLTALMIHEARSNQLPVEQLRLDTSVSSESWQWWSKPTEVPPSVASAPGSILIYGLYAQCAQWNPSAHCIVDASDLSLTPLPVLHIKVLQGPAPGAPIAVAGKQSSSLETAKPPSNDYASQGTKQLELPVYRTLARARSLPTASASNLITANYQEPLVLSLSLPSQLTATHLLKRGAALFTQTNE